jgi:hypothetical protein
MRQRPGDARRATRRRRRQPGLGPAVRRGGQRRDHIAIKQRAHAHAPRYSPRPIIVLTFLADVEEVAEAEDIIGPETGLVGRLDRMARARSHRLRLHEKCEDTGAAKAIAEALRENVPLDPHEPVFEDVFAEPNHWYRHVRDHLGWCGGGCGWRWARRGRRARSRGRRSRGARRGVSSEGCPRNSAPTVP